MQCDAFLANANRIFFDADSSPDECAGRAIVHAAYYAVYHLVADKLALAVDGSDQAKHSDLKRRLEAYIGPDRTLNEARRHFPSLQRARIDADYKVAQKLTLDSVRIALSRAGNIYKAAGITPHVS